MHLSTRSVPGETPEQTEASAVRKWIGWASLKTVECFVCRLCYVGSHSMNRDDGRTDRLSLRPSSELHNLMGRAAKAQICFTAD
jgi:hypothetical protein